MHAPAHPRKLVVFPSTTLDEVRQYVHAASSADALRTVALELIAELEDARRESCPLGGVLPCGRDVCEVQRHH